MSNSIKEYRNLVEQPWGKMFYEMIYRQLDLPDTPELNILDYGSGFCITANHYAEYHNVIAIEPNSEMSSLRVHSNQYTFLSGGLELLKTIPNNNYDIVICHNVLEYADNKSEILRELSRILKPGGRLSIVKHNLRGRIISESVLKDTPKSALELLNNSFDNAQNMFGNRDTYDNQFLLNFADDFGLTCENVFGIRTFFALSSNNRIKYTDEWYANMIELEMKACNIDEYKNIAFFNHLIFTKNKEKTMDSYIKKVRKSVGNDELILNYAGCIIFDDENRLLLQKRADCEKWGFLGGMVEFGESVEEAAVREVREESGLDVEIASLYGVYSKYYAEFTNGDKAQPIVHLFKAKIIGGELIDKNDETLELKFFDLDKIPPLFCKQHQDALDDIISGREYVYR